MKKNHDVIIVGAGAAGIGMASLLKKLGIGNFVVLEKHQIGGSFKKWPKEMRFISPSFNANMFNIIDLNAITPDTSPAEILRTEHPSGEEYAKYLTFVANKFDLPIIEGIDVKKIIPTKTKFKLSTSKGTFTAKFVVWAAGEFFYPNNRSFPGARYCIHNCSVGSWKNLKGNRFTIIGGFESGMDAAIQLAKLGKGVKVIDSGVSSEVENKHGVLLSPYTLDRLKYGMRKGLIQVITNCSVKKIEKSWNKYKIFTNKGNFKSKTRPIIATGFVGSIHLIGDLFEWVEDGTLFLNENDESTLFPGLFVAGSQMYNEGVFFHAIHKFRVRFIVIGEEIAKRLKIKVDTIDEYKKDGFYIKDIRSLRRKKITI